MKTKIEWQAEAFSALQVAQQSGINHKYVVGGEYGVVIVYNNGTITTNNGRHVEFELNGSIYSVDL